MKFMVNISKTFSVLVCPIYDLTIETFSSTDRQDKTRGEWTCLLPIYDVSERWAISFPPSRTDGGWISHSRFPQSNANVKDRLKIEEGNLNLESFQFLRGEQVKTDVFMAGQASSSSGESPYRAAKSGQK